jgi:hypothetical protein
MWWTLVKTAINLLVEWTAERSLTRITTVSFSKRTPFPVISSSRTLSTVRQVLRGGLAPGGVPAMCWCSEHSLCSVTGSGCGLEVEVDAGRRRLNGARTLQFQEASRRRNCPFPRAALVAANRRACTGMPGAGIATGYGLEDGGVGVQVPVGARFFSSSQRPDRLWGPPSLLPNDYRGLFLWG